MNLGPDETSSRPNKPAGIKANLLKIDINPLPRDLTDPREYRQYIASHISKNTIHP
jgi:hypothetical protein